jgi:hypothetical protein
MQLLALLGTLAHFNVFAFVWTVFWIAVDAFVIMYLLKPEVKAAFQQQPMARAASALTQVVIETSESRDGITPSLRTLRSAWNSDLVHF